MRHLARQHVGAEVVPTTAEMTAAEVINWIAFKVSVARDMSLVSNFKATWGHRPDDLALGYAIREAVGLLTVDDRTRYLDHQQRSRSEGPAAEIVHARATISAMLANGTRSATQLHAWFQASQEAALHIAGEVARATVELVAGLRSEKLRVTAMAVEHLEPDHPSKRVDRSAAVVPAIFFRTPGVTLDRYGRIYAPNHRGFTDALFTTSEVLALWPSSQSVNPATHAPLTDGAPKVADRTVTAGQKMRSILKELLDEGVSFGTKKEAHAAVCKRVDMNRRPRGYSYDNFRENCSDLLQ